MDERDRKVRQLGMERLSVKKGSRERDCVCVCGAGRRGGFCYGKYYHNWCVCVCVRARWSAQIECQASFEFELCGMAQGRWE